MLTIYNAIGLLPQKKARVRNRSYNVFWARASGDLAAIEVIVIELNCIE